APPGRGSSGAFRQAACGRRIVPAGAVDGHDLAAEVTAGGDFEGEAVSGEGGDGPGGVAVGRQQDESHTAPGEHGRKAGSEALHDVGGAPGLVEGAPRLPAEEGRVPEDEVETLPGGRLEEV